jgi:hypothetical protein
MQALGKRLEKRMQGTEDKLDAHAEHMKMWLQTPTNSNTTARSRNKGVTPTGNKQSA